MLGGGGSRRAAGVPGWPVLVCGCSFGFGRGFVDEVGGEGGSEEEVEDVDENEDEEEVMVLGDVGCVALQAGAALWAAAASAAATAGRMEGMSSGRGPGVAGWGDLPVTWQPGGPIRSAAAGEGGAGLRSPPFGLGWAGILRCVTVCGLVSAGGEQFAWAAFGGQGGWAWGFGGVCGLCVWVTGRVECAAGRGASSGLCGSVAGCGGR